MPESLHIVMLFSLLELAHNYLQLNSFVPGFRSKFFCQVSASSIVVTSGAFLIQTPIAHDSMVMRSECMNRGAVSAKWTGLNRKHGESPVNTRAVCPSLSVSGCVPSSRYQRPQ